MPMTSLTWTSRQALTHRLQWMQASRLTAMAGCERSALGLSSLGKRDSDTSMAFAQAGKADWVAWASLTLGWSAINSSKTMWRADFARSVSVFTFMPAVGFLTQEAASTRSPSTSTMQAR